MVKTRGFKARSRSRSFAKSSRKESKSKKARAIKGAKVKGKIFPRGLYPTVSISDSCNALGHFAAAYICFQVCEGGERVPNDYNAVSLTHCFAPVTLVRLRRVTPPGDLYLSL